MREKPADGEIMFAAGILAGSLNDLKGYSVAQEQVRHVVQWLIALVDHPALHDVRSVYTEMEEEGAKG